MGLMSNNKWKIFKDQFYEGRLPFPSNKTVAIVSQIPIRTLRQQPPTEVVKQFAHNTSTARPMPLTYEWTDGWPKKYYKSIL